MSFNLQGYIARALAKQIKERFEIFPIVAIIGSRQVGKSTLAKNLLSDFPNSTFIDLESDSDLHKLENPELFFSGLRDQLICIDEIQRKPDIFRLLRVLVDRRELKQQYLVLGSASPELLKQGSESLAGRIEFLELTPFLFEELSGLKIHPQELLDRLWLRGGFPRSFLAGTDKQSFLWRQTFIRTFIERDVFQLGFSIPPQMLLRFWKIITHCHGQMLNTSQIGASLGISHTTIRKYLDIFVQTFLVRTLSPYEANFRKRLVKTPKLYIRDSGILHALLNIRSRDELYGNPLFGASWEGWCIEQIIHAMPNWNPFFYRTSSGEEIDLILQQGKRLLAFECKASLTPRLSKGIEQTLALLEPEKMFVVCPMITDGYPMRDGVEVVGMRECLHALESLA